MGGVFCTCDEVSDSHEMLEGLVGESITVIASSQLICSRSFDTTKLNGCRKLTVLVLAERIVCTEKWAMVTYF